MSEVIRRKNQGLVTETVNCWHSGAGSPGGRTYLVLYCPDGRVRIDVSGAWSSYLHTVWLAAHEVRPTSEWEAYLAETGQSPVTPRWCDIDGREIPAERIDQEDPADPEMYCSTECYIDSMPKR